MQISLVTRGETAGEIGNSMDVDGRVAVVTGAASGIGAATASLLRAIGARVVAWDLSEGADIRPFRPIREPDRTDSES